MALPKQIIIKETLSELKSLYKQHGELIGKRIRVLIAIKKHEKTGISKRALSDLTGANHNSIVKWRKTYNAKGISSLLVHGRTGFKKSVITSAEHNAIKKKLNDPKNGIRGYVELLEWVKNDLNKDLKYITLLKYVERNFGTKIKVARKSHVKKDPEAVDSFKKTSVRSVKNSSSKLTKNTKK